MTIIKLLCVTLLLMSTDLWATEKTQHNYISLRTNEVNLRSGPSIRYPIRFTYQRKGWPLKVLARFEDWKKVEDLDQTQGWIHESQLSQKRFVVITGSDVVKAYRLPVENASTILLLEKGVLAEVDSCKKNWCKIETYNNKVWVKQKYLWGVSP